MSGAALLTGAAPILTWALPQGQQIPFPGEEGMVLRSFRFIDLESPVEYFNTWLTPVPHFFVRNHMYEPTELDARDWRISVGGEVDKPLTLSLAELSKIEAHSVVNTLECAGNGRTFIARRSPASSGERERWGQRVSPDRGCAMCCSARE